jgi:DNA-binding MarR family transcriptional regulator
VRAGGDCPDLEGRSIEADLEQRPVADAQPVAAVPGAESPADAALLRLCRVMTAATIHAGNAQRPALSATDVRVLTVLAAAKTAGLPLGAIASCLGAGTATVSRVCAELADRHLLKREPHGGQLRLLLTAAGAEALGELNRDRLRRIESLLHTMPDSSRADVLAAAQAMARATAGPDPLW